VEAVTDVAPENKPMTVSDSTQPTEQATRAVVAQNAVEAPESSSNSTDSLQRGNSAAQRANDLLMQAIKAADEAKAQMLIAQKELQRDMRASLNLEKIAASESKRNRQKTSEAPAAGNELESTLAANTLRFAWMKSTLDEDSNKKIARVVAELKKNPEIDIQITGHTDNNGTEDLNKWLGLIRARRVRQQLIAQGIEPKRISVHSSGSASPIAENDTAEGRWKNRRVEFSVSAK
jgi:outer membrane protein OmpA-like peptidoglycan-associated protein